MCCDPSVWPGSGSEAGRFLTDEARATAQPRWLASPQKLEPGLTAAPCCSSRRVTSHQQDMLVAVRFLPRVLRGYFLYCLWLPCHAGSNASRRRDPVGLLAETVAEDLAASVGGRQCWRRDGDAAESGRFSRRGLLPANVANVEGAVLKMKFKVERPTCLLTFWKPHAKVMQEARATQLLCILYSVLCIVSCFLYFVRKSVPILPYRYSLHYVSGLFTHSRPLLLPISLSLSLKTDDSERDTVFHLPPFLNFSRKYKATANLPRLTKEVLAQTASLPHHVRGPR